MGRLIDYDVLLKDVQNTITAQSDTMDWLNMISRQPTAFDMEKVVADLEDKFEQTVAEILDKTGSDFTIADFNIKRYSNRICEIVRKGGAE